jgi:hypothetical protein
MSKLETKIASLIAKAEATPYPEEAEAFMAKAEELMLAHGIERANLDAKRPGQKREEIGTHRITIPNGHGYGAAMAAVAHALAPSFSVRSLQGSISGGTHVIWFIGHKSDVALAEALASTLMKQSRMQALHWWKTQGKAAHPNHVGNDAYFARREFIFAFASGVRARLAETRDRVVAEAETGTALVLSGRAAAVASWIDDNMDVGKGRKTKRRVGGEAAASAGRQAGRDAVAVKALK